MSHDAPCSVPLDGDLVAGGEGCRSAAGSASVVLVPPQLYPATIAAMQAARAKETAVHQRYTAFAQKAKQEGYAGIAYLCTAFAASEGIHGANFGRILTALGADAPPLPKAEIKVGKTRENLISRRRRGRDRLDRRPLPGHARADHGWEGTRRRRPASVTFAGASERQHRDLLQQAAALTRRRPLDRVATTIGTPRPASYFVCQAAAARR